MYLLIPEALSNDILTVCFLPQTILAVLLTGTHPQEGRSLFASLNKDEYMEGALNHSHFITKPSGQEQLFPTGI